MTASQRERENLLARARYAANVEVEREKVRLKGCRYRRPSRETVIRRRLLRRGLKICSRCRVVKRLDAFHKNARASGGRSHPLARGGEHSYANTQVSHPPCNRRKGYSLPGERKVLVS